MILSNINRLINLFIIIIIWACVTEILKLIIAYFKVTNTVSLVYIYLIILFGVLILNYHLNGDILVDDVFYKKLEYDNDSKTFVNNNFNNDNDNDNDNQNQNYN